MTKANFLALLTASGVGFVSGAFVTYNPATQSGVFVHALRVHGAVGSDSIEAYLTRATAEADGGADLEDLGGMACVVEDGGTTAPLRIWVRNNCDHEDGGNVLGVEVIEARPVTAPDDGGNGSVSLEVYGTSGVARCTVEKTFGFRNFLKALDCPVRKRRASTSPL